jgi:hypothetical protein
VININNIVGDYNMVVRVNGGIINDQTLTGGLRFFKIVGPFAWTISDGTVNLPSSVSGGETTSTTYFQVGNGRPVPGSAAEIVLKEISKQADIVLIGLSPSAGAGTTELHIGLSASALGWGSDVPPYSVPPANADEQNLPTTPTAAATQMQTAIQALSSATVYITAGTNPVPPALPNTNTPVTASASFAAVTVTEVSFSLGSLTYYTLR